MEKSGINCFTMFSPDICTLVRTRSTMNKIRYTQNRMEKMAPSLSYMPSAIIMTMPDHTACVPLFPCISSIMTSTAASTPRITRPMEVKNMIVNILVKVFFAFFGTFSSTEYPDTLVSKSDTTNFASQ